MKFYRKLKKFGYKLFLKPVKFYKQLDGSIKSKANCDVEMAFYLMKEKARFDKVLILSGDGDFLTVLLYLRKIDKDVKILARGERCAREMRLFAGSDFKDFGTLRKKLCYEKKMSGHTKYPLNV